MSIVSSLAKASWAVLDRASSFYKTERLPTPSWSSTPLLRPSERHFPPLGPRQTQSVCPTCQLETRDGIIHGRQDISALFADNGLIEAEILEVDGQVIMRKTCPRHGQTDDVLSRHASFFWRMEKLFPGCDFPRQDTASSHGAHSVQYGRGSFLIVDLTNRCNMKCEPCFMNANELGHVHELDLSDIHKQLDHALTVEPRREVNILFSGGEPTISPYFLEAVSYAKSIGLHKLHVATNGLRFAEDPNFAIAASGAGLHGVYLQLDGVTDESNKHRGIANLFTLKAKALEHISAAGLHTTLQVTVMRELNHSTVAEIVSFATKHADKIIGVFFQPIMFSGRDEQVTPSRREQQRYTLSDLSADLSRGVEFRWDPIRDWFPMATYGTLATLFDALNPNSSFGASHVNAHPNSFVISPLVVHKKSGLTVSLSSFFDVERFLADVESLLSRAPSPTLIKLAVIASLNRNFRQNHAPVGFGLRELFRLTKRAVERAISTDKQRINPDDNWCLFIVSGASWQDLFSYELPNIQLTTALVADLGMDGSSPAEIAFSFKNAAGWRQVIETRASVPTLSEWHRTRGRHAIYANGINVTVDELTSTLTRVSAVTLQSEGASQDLMGVIG